MATWIIPCNIRYYDVIGAFNRLNRIDWKQSTNIEPSDTVYIYVGKPYQAILYKCRVTKANLTSCEIDDSEFVLIGDNYVNYGNHMELQLERVFMENQLSFSKLKQEGLKGYIQSPRRANDRIQKLLDSAE